MIGQATLNLLMKTDNACGNIVWGKPIKPVEQSIAGGLLFPFQDGKVVCVEKHRHEGSPFDLSLANQTAEAGDLGKGFIAGKDSDDFTVPRVTLLPANDSLELCEFLFDPCQSRFQLSCSLRHGFIICECRWEDNGFVANLRLTTRP
jgi:hypothetical protein